MSWLSGAIYAFKNRGDDLEAALGIAGDESLTIDQRDELLRVVLDLSPGESFTARGCAVLDCLDGSQHNNKLAARLVLRLRRSRIRLPRTVRHLRCIANGHRCEDSFL